MGSERILHFFLGGGRICHYCPDVAFWQDAQTEGRKEAEKKKCQFLGERGSMTSSLGCLLEVPAAARTERKKLSHSRSSWPKLVVLFFYPFLSRSVFSGMI